MPKGYADHPFKRTGKQRSLKQQEATRKIAAETMARARAAKQAKVQRTPTESWWLDPERFYVRAKAETARMFGVDGGPIELPEAVEPSKPEGL